MLNKTTLIWVIEHLRKLGKREIKPNTNNSGLCDEMFYHITNDDYFIFIDKVWYFQKDWENYSGFYMYPVCPQTGEYNLESRLFWRYHTNNLDMWNPDDEYDKLRLEFCLFLSDKFEELLNSGEYDDE